MEKKKKSIFNIDVIREKMENIDDNLGVSVLMLILVVAIILDIFPAYILAFKDFPLWIEGLMNSYQSSIMIIGAGVSGSAFVLGWLGYCLYVFIGNIYRITYNRAQEKAKLRVERQKKESEVQEDN